MPRFLKTASEEIRYTTGRNETNITRSELRPLWQEMQTLPTDQIEEIEPPLTPSYVRDMIRKQRADMAQQQGFGNLNTYFILKGMTPEEIRRGFPRLVAEQATQYQRELGPKIHQKKTLEASKDRNAAPLIEE